MARVGLRQYFTNVADVFVAIQNCFVAAGWTLHDDVSSSVKVFKSQGEAGKYAPIYVRLSLSGSEIMAQMWLYWDAEAHSGTTSVYHSAYQKTSYATNPGYFAVAVNKDFFIIGGNSSNTFVFGGFCTPFLTMLTNTTDAITAGASVSIPVVSSAGFVKGGKVQIVGVNTEGRDQLTVESVPDGTHVVVASLPRNYASGAYIGEHPCPAILSGRSSSKDTVTILCPWSAVGTENVLATLMVLIKDVMDGNTMRDPDETSGYYLLTPFNVYEDASLIGYIPTDVMCGTVPASWSDVFAITEAGTPEQGTATSSTGTTLVDSAKSWATNEWQGKFIIIADGTGNGQAREIVSNTATELTVSAWDVNPDTTSTYRIVDMLYRHLGALSAPFIGMFEDRCVQS